MNFLRAPFSDDPEEKEGGLSDDALAELNDGFGDEDDFDDDEDEDVDADLYDDVDEF